MFSRRMRALLVSAAIVAAPAAFARDADTAQGYVKEAKELIENRSFEDAAKKLELAEAELDGVDAAAKAPIQKSIDGLKAQITDNAAAANKEIYGRKLERALTECEGAIGNLVTWPGAVAEFEELAKDETAKAALGDDLVAAQKKVATFKKLHAKKAAVQIKEQITDQDKRFDEEWVEAKKTLNDADASPNSKQSAGEDILRSIESLRKRVSQLPEDDEMAKSINAKLDGIEKDVVKLALADQAKQKLETLKSNWDSYQEDFKGWEAEAEGPTFEQYSHESSETMFALKCPKTKELLNRTNQWLENRKEDQEYKTLQAVPEVKAFGDNIQKLHDDALAKMEKVAEAVIADAEKAKVTADNLNSFNTLKDGLKNNIASSTKLEALEGRVQKLITGFEKATTGADEAKVAAYNELKEKAEADWPAMKAKYSPEEGFDPNNPGNFKGKTIIITTDNLMGYRFKPGDFPFATTLNGLPVAGKYDPAVAKAVAEVESKIGRGIGDNDDDGKWEVIAVVEGTTGRMLQRKQATGDVTVDGQKVGTVTSEYADPVDAPIITIVAAHCGPLAVSSK